MTLRGVRFLLLGILGGIGVIYLIVSLALTAVGQMQIAGEDPEMFPVAGLIFGALGIVLLCVGVGLFIGLGRGEKRREELFCFGTVVQGVVEDIRCNYAVQVNKRHPWYVYVSCRHPVTYEQVTVRSHSVFDLTVKKGDKVRVAFDPMNERRHAVELPQGGDVR